MRNPEAVGMNLTLNHTSFVRSENPRIVKRTAPGHREVNALIVHVKSTLKIVKQELRAPDRGRDRPMGYNGLCV